MSKFLLNQDHYFLRQFQPQSLTGNEEFFIRGSIEIEEKFALSSLKRLSPVALAYIGDAVYELFMRTRFLFPPKRISDYHKKVVNEVKAETQASYLKILEPYLTKTEKEIVRRGRNAVSKSPRRLSLEVYQNASSLETLIGYLYLQNSQRLDYLFSLIVDN